MLADISSRLSGDRATDPLENQFGSNMRAKQSYTLPKIAVVDPSFPINTSQAIYESWILAKATAETGFGLAWAHAVKLPIFQSQDELGRKAREQAGGKISGMTVLNDREMSGDKKLQVERLVAERNTEESNKLYEWKPAYIGPESHITLEGKETLSVEVVLQRDLRQRDVTRCICGQSDYPGLPGIRDFSGTPLPDAGRTFIQCDTCRVWQHCGCVGINDDAAIPNHYFCELCRKDLHCLIIDPQG